MSRKKKRSNKAWNPREEVLKRIHELKCRGYSYRDIGRMYRRDNSTIRKYHLRYLETHERPEEIKKPSWWKRLFGSR